MKKSLLKNCMLKDLITVLINKKEDIRNRMGKMSAIDFRAPIQDARVKGKSQFFR